jgi:hypothetical protein
MKKAKKVLLISSISVVSLILIAILGLLVWIQVDVNYRKSIAHTSFPGEKTVLDSMILYMNDSSKTFKDRNYMVWAIGQIADKKALPFLLVNYTGQPCKHYEYLCQYELEKAINRCDGKVTFEYKDKKNNQ